MSQFEKVKEFLRACNCYIGKSPGYSYLEARVVAFEEEVEEVLDEVYKPDFLFDRTKLSKELADVLYTVYGIAAAHDLPLDQVFDRVHLSNMSKIVDGKAVFRKDGKVLKGPDYKPPDLGDLF